MSIKKLWGYHICMKIFCRFMIFHQKMFKRHYGQKICRKQPLFQQKIEICKLHIGLDMSGVSGWLILLHMITKHHFRVSNLHKRQKRCILLGVLSCRNEVCAINCHRGWIFKFFFSLTKNAYVREFVTHLGGSRRLRTNVVCVL